MATRGEKKEERKVDKKVHLTNFFLINCDLKLRISFTKNNDVCDGIRGDSQVYNFKKFSLMSGYDVDKVFNVISVFQHVDLLGLVLIKIN